MGQIQVLTQKSVDSPFLSLSNSLFVVVTSGEDGALEARGDTYCTQV